MKFAIGLAAIGAAACFAASAEGAITVLGGGYGHSCYEAAELKRPLKSGLVDCDTALTEEALSQDDRAATYVNRGILYMFERDYRRAIADYDAAIKIDRKLAEAYVNKGIAVLHQGSNDDFAIELLSTGLALDPIRPEVAFYTRGIAHEQRGNTREAYNDYSQAAALKPDWEDPKKELQRFKVIDK